MYFILLYYKWRKIWSKKIIKSLVGLNYKFDDNSIIIKIINKIITQYPEIINELKDTSDKLEKLKEIEKINI